MMVGRMQRTLLPLVTIFFFMTPSMMGALCLHGIDCPNQDGFTSLMLAARDGNNEDAQKLIAKGANIDHVGGEGNAWTLARLFHHDDVLSTLRENHADETIQTKYPRRTAIFAEIIKDDEILQSFAENENFEQFLNDNPDVVTRIYPSRSTLLHAVARIGDIEKMNLMLQKGAADLIDAQDPRGLTPLMWAAWKGHDKVVQLLIENDANISLKDHYERTALVLARMQENKDVDVALMFTAAIHGNVEEFEESLLHIGLKINSQDQQGFTLLMRAVEKQHFEIVESLLRYIDGVNIGLVNNDGQTVFDLARKNEDTQVFEKLLLHATFYDQFDVLEKVLNESPKDIIAKTINAIHDCWFGFGQSEYMTPLMVASKRGHYKLVELLIEHGADINFKDEYDTTALMFACMLEVQDAAVLKLLEYDVDINAMDREKWTALMHAANLGNLCVVDALLRKGAEVDQQNDDGNTALMLVVRNAKRTGNDTSMDVVQVVDCLLRNNADVNIRNHMDDTALGLVISGYNSGTMPERIYRLFVPDN